MIMREHVSLEAARPTENPLAPHVSKGRKIIFNLEALAKALDLELHLVPASNR